jgi:rfaE bifunctional protein nucleotidyltransferase chain/domain
MASSSKIKTRDQLITEQSLWRKASIKVGFTSGVFDILHSGHVEYLERARALCDILVVGVNSDQSVRSNKGDLRPINSEAERVRILAGLASVDFIFVFSESNNNKNIELLKPDVYIKAGDYSKDKLSSASIIESYGGRVELVKFVEGRSSTSVIEKISAQALAGAVTAAPDKKEIKTSGKAAFIDRDGTINKEVEYLSNPDEFELVPGAIEGMKALAAAGYEIVIVTNQPGIGLGYYTAGDLFRVNAKLLKAAGDAGVPIRKIYFCPHTKLDGCSCRKPGAGMLLRARDELGIDLSKSIMIGDTDADIGAGRAAGCRTVLVLSGKTKDLSLLKMAPEQVVDSLGSLKIAQ